MRVKKPWGYEEQLVTNPYSIKELRIKAGCSKPEGTHQRITETLIVQWGTGSIYHDGMITTVTQGGMVHIPKGKIHKVGASKLSDLVILEISGKGLTGE